MKLVILLAATFGYTIYSTSGFTGSESTCARETFQEPCGNKCILDSNRPCCEISRCKKCWTDIGLDKCGPITGFVLRVNIQAMNRKWEAYDCTESENYPSTTCLYYFYPAWFYVIPLLILAVTAGVALIVIRRRRRS